MTQDAKMVEYSKEISPMIRAIMELKEALKEFKENSEGFQEFVEQIKSIQEDAKSYLEKNSESSSLLDEIREREVELKEAIKGMAKGSAYKPAEIKAYMVARNKEDGVKKVLDKGELFSDLNQELGSV